MGGYMKFETRRFGVIEVNEDKMIRFKHPIIGFPELVNYVLIDTGHSIKWLQSLEDADVAFPVVNPFDVHADYDIEVPSCEAATIELDSVHDAQVWTVTVLSKDLTEVRTNLRAPVIINRRNGLACQVVLSNGKLPVRYAFIPKPQSNKEVAGVSSDT
jgi:flagellar assembly factor FliW